MSRVAGIPWDASFASKLASRLEHRSAIGGQPFAAGRVLGGCGRTREGHASEDQGDKYERYANASIHLRHCILPSRQTIRRILRWLVVAPLRAMIVTALGRAQLAKPCVQD
jgi:hypothetical protein